MCQLYGRDIFQGATLFLSTLQKAAFSAVHHKCDFQHGYRGRWGWWRWWWWDQSDFFFFFNQPTNANVIFWLKQVTVQRPYFDLQHAKPRYGNEILMDKDRKLLKMLLKSFEVIMVSSLKKGEDEILEVLKCFKLFNFGCHSQKKNCHGNVAVVAWDHS